MDVFEPIVALSVQKSISWIGHMALKLSKSND